jgi:hypothetical protein
MRKIICLTDYKNGFGSKWNSYPYRSGMDKNYLRTLFQNKGFDIEFISMSQVNFLDPGWLNAIVIYTSSEEKGLHYKNFIEDIVFGLKDAGAKLIPDPVFLRANNNKVFMEILRQTRIPENLQTLSSHRFGTVEELEQALQSKLIKFPCVIKESEGAQSRGVFLAKDERDIKQLAKKISRTASFREMLKEKVRLYKHRGYKPESFFQKKFIIQPFVNGLVNDWKILVYGEKYFVLRREIKKNDFRASGSGLNYTSGTFAKFPEKMLNMVRTFFQELDVPHLSLDFAFDGQKGYFFEFQVVYFGTSTHFKSKDYYEFQDGSWVVKKNDIDQEEVFVHSIVKYLEKNNF